MASTSERRHLTSHPWISFAPVDLSQASPELWMLLGEARSKIDHMAGVPLRPDVAQQLLHVYLAKGALATTAIEGNTLSEEEVLHYLQGKLRLPPSQEYLGVEINNILTGFNRIVGDLAERRDQSLTPARIMEFNRIVLNGLELDEDVVPGQFRSHSALVGRYRGAPPEDCEYLVQKLCEWLSGEAFKPSSPGMAVAFALIRAVLAHLYLVWIHPFGDGNGRTARLMELQILLSSGVPQPAVHLLSNHYNTTRTEYYKQLDAASRNQGDLRPFITYAVRGFVDQLRQQIAVIRDHQIDVAWRNYVHDSFDTEASVNARRRRHLVLDLSTADGPIPRARLRHLSPRLAEEYKGLAPRTFDRDLVALLERGLVRRVEGGYLAHRDLILAFLPWASPESTDGEAAQAQLPLEDVV